MSNYDDGRDSALDTAISRDSGADTARHGGAPYGAPQQMPPYGYQQWVMRPKRVYPIETKPFFLTSEFWLSLAMIVGAAIAAGTSESIDARLFWTLATAITIGYVISRGIAKSGTKSRAWDPRDDLMQGARERMTHGNS